MKKSIDSSYKNHGRILGWGSGPDADWKVMFTAFLILLAISTLLNIFLYRNAKSSFENEGVSVELPIDKEELRRTANFYEQKKLDFESVSKTPETVSDPSI
jgi:hypothetical protein